MKERDGVRGLVPTRAYGNKDKTYLAYLEALNPRENEDVQLAMAASGDPRYQEFLARLQTRRYDRINLATIAKACSIDLAEFNNWWNKESTQRSIAIAQTRSVEIVRDMTEDARSVNAVCERCDGLKFVTAPQGLPADTPGYKPSQYYDEEAGRTITMWVRDCPNCTDGKVRRPGDAHARDKVLELGGLIKKGPGVSITQNFSGAAHASAIGALDVMTIDVTSEE